MNFLQISLQEIYVQSEIRITLSLFVFGPPLPLWLSLSLSGPPLPLISTSLCLSLSLPDSSWGHCFHVCFHSLMMEFHIHLFLFFVLYSSFLCSQAYKFYVGVTWWKRWVGVQFLQELHNHWAGRNKFNVNDALRKYVFVLVLSFSWDFWLIYLVGQTSWVNPT